MTETQRESVPRDDGSELETALAFLRFARHCVLKKTEGLDEEQLRRALVPSGTSLLGLVQHLTDGEVLVRPSRFRGRRRSGRRLQHVFHPERSAEAVLEAYRSATTASDAILSAVADLGTAVSEPIDGEHLTVRWVSAHYQ